MAQTERTPLLRDTDGRQDSQAIVKFEDGDEADPKQWPARKKMANVAIIALMAFVAPLASAMFTPGISQIADSLHTSTDTVVGATTCFIVMQGLGPLILAPLSETFGRRALYLSCFTVFFLLQIPTALSPNIETLLVMRLFAGFFGSVGVANGGGTISDMFDPSQRASVFGWYLLGPLLGPSLGPLFGGIIVGFLDWRWIFWALALVCGVNTLLGFVFLKETYAPTILQRRCDALSHEHGKLHVFPGQDSRRLSTKVWSSMGRPLKILFTQPIVLVMATYQAVIFAILFTLFTNMESIFSAPPYNFDSVKIGLLYLFPGLGFVLAVRFLVPRIDVIYNSMTKANNGVSKPEYRLPLANIGSVLLPVSMFWFGWSVEYRVHWLAAILPTVFLGLGQVAVVNTVQNYYIDAFEKYAASAIAAGVMFRSLIGGVVPLFAPAWFRALGYGWGWSAFGFLLIAIAPSPLLFMKFGPFLRERFAISL